MASDTVAGTKLHVGDFIVIVGYFAFVLFIGLWSSRKNRGSAGGYFLAGRNMNFILVGSSLFASNIGSIHFVGLAGSGAASGISVGLYEINAMYILLILGYLFLPVYISSGVFTMPEYMKMRFGGKRIQIYLAILSLFVYIFTKISADLYAGAIFIEQSLKWDIYASITLLLAIAAIFTIAGGLTAVIWTDFVQAILMILGAIALMILAFAKVGGLSGMVEKYPNAIANQTIPNTTCGYPRKDYMNLWRDKDADIPWAGVIGLSINSIWYWCSDQVIVQRTLAAKNFDHAKAGTLFCGYLKILPLFLLIFPGMIARILYPDTVGCATPETCMEVCGSRSGCSNIAYPSLVIDLMPPGARGLMLAVMLAALMSSLTSIFNSSCTIFAMDIWLHIRKKASELEIMIIGRIFVVVLVVISIVWIPVLRASEGSELFVYIQEVSSFMQPPICCVYLLSILWDRLNELGAFSGLVLGMVVGLIRFIVEYSYTVPDCGDPAPDPRPAIVSKFHYLYFSIFVFCLTGITAIVISLLTKPIDKRCLERLTWKTRHSKRPRLDIDKVMNDASIPELVSYVENDNNGSPEKDNTEMDVFREKEITGKEEAKEEMIDNSSINMKEKEALNEQHNPVEVVLEDKHNEVTYNEPISIFKRIAHWLCGMDESSRRSLASHGVVREDMVSIKENRKWKITSNVLAVFLMGVVVFHFIYFA
ncbi:sodium/glucose cotransporter 4-like isoform X1 [Mytilus edulis]|uniref:sodium/glucose cotransporter 4-like isoform X1 n=1 Tax=Mytilus edulis TaxID=6550 RepID=UPI0039F0BCDD